jgi:hypothetical protein
MNGKHIAVFGIFRDVPHAESGMQSLREHGFREEDLSVLAADNKGNKDFAVEKHTKAPEGATAGAGAGAVIGGAFGALAALGTITIPGLGPFLAAGPIVSALAGVGAGGVAGGVLGGLIGLGVPEFEAKRYEGLIKEGRALLSVHCDNSEWVKRAKDTLRRAGAHHISAVGESSADYEPSDHPKVRHDAA